MVVLRALRTDERRAIVEPPLGVHDRAHVLHLVCTLNSCLAGCHGSVLTCTSPDAGPRSLCRAFFALYRSNLMAWKGSPFVSALFLDDPAVPTRRAWAGQAFDGQEGAYTAICHSMGRAETNAGAAAGGRLGMSALVPWSLGPYTWVALVSSPRRPRLKMPQRSH